MAAGVAKVKRVTATQTIQSVFMTAVVVRPCVAIPLALRGGRPSAVIGFKRTDKLCGKWQEKNETDIYIYIYSHTPILI